MSTRTSYQEAGTLQRPGPIGRAVRLLFGLGAFYAVFQAVKYRAVLMETTLPDWSWIPIVLIALYVFPYVINLGWGRSWGRWPQFTIVALLGFVAVVNFISTGNLWGKAPGSLLFVWMAYTFAHLGLSFILSTVIATPGCEMRAVPHLWMLLTGRATAEHHCPAGPIDRLDRWELRLRRRG
jgi:hypothetical protein